MVVIDRAFSVVKECDRIANLCDLNPWSGDCLEVAVAMARILNVQISNPECNVEVAVLVRHKEQGESPDVVHASAMIDDRFFGLAPSSDDLIELWENKEAEDKRNGDRDVLYEILTYEIGELVLTGGQALLERFEGSLKNYNGAPVFNWEQASQTMHAILRSQPKALLEHYAAGKSDRTEHLANAISPQQGKITMNSENPQFLVIGMFDEGQVITDEFQAETGFDAMYLSARYRSFDPDLCMVSAVEKFPKDGNGVKVSFASDEEAKGVYASDFEQHSDSLDEKYPIENSQAPRG